MRCPDRGSARHRRLAIGGRDRGRTRRRAYRAEEGGQGRISVNELRWARRRLTINGSEPASGRVSRCCSRATSSLSSRSAPRSGRAQARRSRARIRAASDPRCQRRPCRPRPQNRAGLRDGWGLVVPAEPVQPRDAGETAARLGLQALCFCDGARNGFSPYSVVEDAPISIPQGPGQTPWEPVNYEGSYVGETTLRMRSSIRATLSPRGWR